MSKQPMMGNHQFVPRLYYQFPLDKFVPQNHPLHESTKTIDCNFLYHLVRYYYSHTHQTSVDSIIPVQSSPHRLPYSYNLRTAINEREPINMAYEWFLNYDTEKVISDHIVLPKPKASCRMENCKNKYIAGLSQIIKYSFAG